eukprot:1888614-Pleurochrysis_carterae.AAC.1
MSRLHIREVTKQSGRSGLSICANEGRSKHGNYIKKALFRVTLAVKTICRWRTGTWSTGWRPRAADQAPSEDRRRRSDACRETTRRWCCNPADCARRNKARPPWARA